MVKKKTNRNIIVGILVILALFFIASNVGLLAVGDIPEGWNGFGESINQITELNLISNKFNENPRPYGSYEKKWDSKYWEIKEDLIRGKDSGDQTFLGGSDFEIQTKGKMSLRSGASVTEELISKFNFQDRDFRTEIFFGAFSGGEAESFIDIAFITDSGSINVYRDKILLSERGQENLFEFFNSPIDDITTIFWNGKEVNRITTNKDYRIKISWGVPSHFERGGQVTIKSGIRNPAFKEEYGCQKRPSEQFYMKVYKERNKVFLDDLDSFRKFCLDEAPLKIFTNTGSTTDKRALVDLVNGKVFDVPVGQIWLIEYIGKIEDPETACEKDESFDFENEICLARTLLTFNCPGGFKFNRDVGYCTVATEPSLYNLSEIQTHQDHENNGQFLFEHLFDVDREKQSPNSFTLGTKRFVSDGVSYNGIEKNIRYPEDKDNWDVGFSFGGERFNAVEGEKVQITNELSVEIIEIQARVDDSLEVFIVGYLFEFDTGFIDLSYEPTTLTVSNSGDVFEGGIVTTTEDVVGKTNIEVFEKTLNRETLFELEISENIRTLKVRPFIKIEMPNFNYRLDTKKALIVNDPSKQSGSGNGDGNGERREDVNFSLIFGVIVIIVLVFFVFTRFRKKRR